MRSLDVAYGVPERSVSEDQLRAALAVVAQNFDEAPTRMHCVLGPAGQGIRWFSFACTVFRPGSVLAQDHFTETMESELAELIVVVRDYGDEPGFVEVRGTSGRSLALARSRETITAYSLPPDARRDGELDEIVLAALALPYVRPFVALDEPTYEVVLRGDARDDTFPIVPLDGPLLPVRVNPRFGSGGHGEKFTRKPRAVDTSNVAALSAHVDRIAQQAETEWSARFEGSFHGYARELARIGPAIAPILVERLARPKPNPRTSQIALTALGMVGAGTEAIVPWLARSSEPLRLAAFCALARQGEAARPALTAARGSRKSHERVAAQALLALLDAPEFAPIRAVRAARDRINDESRAAINTICSDTFAHAPSNVLDTSARFAYFLRAAVEGKESSPRIANALYAAPDDAVWSLALFLLETPLAAKTHLGNYAARDSIVPRAAERFGPDFGPVADLLLRFPPLAEDPQLRQLARGTAPVAPKPKQPKQAKPAAKKKPAKKPAKKPTKKKPPKKTRR
ncbi:MAG: hypothetical protein M4D80_04995 [Myxococcota bacterium]|nr:hypothetical protein [Myxococcota bacterium]